MTSLRRRGYTFRALAVVVAAIVLMATGCHFESSNSGDLYANVPYFSQEHYYYCAAACVQMVAWWAGEDISQDEAFAFMNGTIDGITPEELVRGAARYCYSDAYWDMGLPNDTLYFARQISSVSNEVPVICITESGGHTVVLYGGSWHMTVDSNNYRIYYWDEVFYHDPERGGGLDSTAATWKALNCTEFGYACAQVISNTAATAGPKTLADYNPTVYTTGGDETDQRGGPYDY
jgi:hypothetical protein